MENWGICWEFTTCNAYGIRRYDLRLRDRLSKPQDERAYKVFKYFLECIVMLMNKLFTKSIFLRSQFKSVRRIKEITCKSIKVENY